MFDFPRLTELIGAAATDFMSGGQEPVQQLSELLQSAGLDPSVLAGLTESEISALLADHGIDVSPLLEGDFQQALADLGISDEATHG
jgi:hypothetical protein